MESIRFGEHDVFLYRSMLFTASPLLKEIYAESHRHEPWIVRGAAERYGHAPFPAVLYVSSTAREALLEHVSAALTQDPDYADAVVRRFHASAKELLRGVVRARAHGLDAVNAAALVDASARVLSPGIFKEALGPEAAIQLLGQWLPTETLRPQVLALHQPRCLPHFLKLELKLLFFAAQHAERPSRTLVARCIAHFAHHSRFLLEPTPLAEPNAMRDALERTADAHARSPTRLLAARRQLLVQHAARVVEAQRAEHDILAALDRFARYTLRTKRLVLGCLRLLAFIATAEELKHILAMQAARVLRQAMDDAGLEVAATDRAALLAGLTRRGARV